MSSKSEIPPIGDRPFKNGASAEFVKSSESAATLTAVDEGLRDAGAIPLGCARHNHGPCLHNVIPPVCRSNSPQTIASGCPARHFQTPAKQLVHIRRSPLTKRENKSLSAGIEEFNLKRTVFHVTLLPDELVEAGLANCTHAVRIGICSTIVAGGGAI